jgi:hypothetical protein
MSHHDYHDRRHQPDRAPARAHEEASTFSAMMRWPVSFDGVRCLVSPQPVTIRLMFEHRLAVLGPGDRHDDFNTLVRRRTSVGHERRNPAGVGQERLRMTRPTAQW